MPTATPKALPNWRSGCTAASCARASTSWPATSTTSRRSCSRSSAARTPASWFSRSTVIADDASPAVCPGPIGRVWLFSSVGGYIARGIDECFQFTLNVGSGWLIDDFGDALFCDSGDALGELCRGSGQRCVQDSRPAARGPRGLIGLVEADQVMVVNGQMPVLRGCFVNAVEPYLSRRERRDIAAEFVGGMICQRVSRAGCRADPR